MKEYEEIITMNPGRNLRDAYCTLQYYKNRGVDSCIDFNGTMLNSDMTLDDIYKLITGKTYAEFEYEQFESQKTFQKDVRGKIQFEVVCFKRIYTIQDFNNFEVDVFGYKICPNGDYRQIDKFFDKCKFGNCCIFGANCLFNERCIFGDSCRFGSGCVFNEQCRFGVSCNFGECCRFDEQCIFGEQCRFGLDCIFMRGNCIFGDCCRFGESCNFTSHSIFGDSCNFGMRCMFGDCCSFGEDCSFGDSCRFGNNSVFENIKENVDRVLKIDRIGISDGCTYFFKTEKDVYVRCGCFFGTISEFENVVNKKHKEHEKYRKEYIESINYIKAII